MSRIARQRCVFTKPLQKLCIPCVHGLRIVLGPTARYRLRTASFPPFLEFRMKTSLLSLALLAALVTGCRNDNPETAADTAAADTTATADMAATDAMAPAAADPAAMPAAGGDITTVAMGSPDHTTLVSAVQNAGLVDTLKGAGPFTVFAPTNAAFTALPAGTVDMLMMPEMKTDLANVLTYHVVAGNLDAAALTAQIEAGGGQAVLTTVAGGTLTAKAGGPGGITLTDGKGVVANVTAADLKASNGVVHVIDKVVMAK